ncbi:hypothetical protein D3C81_724080 [compost metagenome]
MEELLFVEVTDIAGVQPTVAQALRSGFGQVPVGAHQGWGTQPDHPASTRHLWLVRAVTDTNIDDRQRPTCRLRLVHERVAADSRADAIAFGQAVAGTADDVGLELEHVVQHPGGRRCTAQTKTEQAGGVLAAKAWRRKQLLHHHRRPVELGTALIANEVDGTFDIPLVHQHQAPTAA